ncbi:hypothetical protein EDD37DRAFT_39188 [Exophiala viscosa]|uniref:uncharacterized protein n=1 Tax=Exophiala viscosa TaxID=2486360 RepID=UPI00219F6A6E|nr:hypothetical protein EDD37DRAFT_39188 [Exophiala viscosa]
MDTHCKLTFRSLKTTRGIVRSYIKHHQDIKTILTSDAPISSLVVKLGASKSPSGDAGSQTSSWGPIVDTPDTSLVIESSEGSRERDLFTEEVIDVPDMNDDLMNYTATSPSDHTECDRGCTPHSEPQRPMQTIPPAGWVPTALFGPPMPKARPPNPRPPTPLPPSEDAAVNQGDGSAGRYDYPPPEKPGGPAHKASVPQARRSELRPPTPDAAPQDIIVDRNDDLGVRHEYRPPRKPRRPPRSLEWVKTCGHCRTHGRRYWNGQSSCTSFTYRLHVSFLIRVQWDGK